MHSRPNTNVCSHARDQEPAHARRVICKNSRSETRTRDYSVGTERGGSDSKINLPNSSKYLGSQIKKGYKIMQNNINFVTLVRLKVIML